MITIVKDGNKMKCSQNTYDTMYKRLGYEILQEEIIKKTKEQKNTKNKNKKGD